MQVNEKGIISYLVMTTNGKVLFDKDYECKSSEQLKESLRDLVSIILNKGKTLKKVATVKIISISQLHYSGNGKFTVALVDFAVHNPDLNQKQLSLELGVFKGAANRVIGHNFYNTVDEFETTIEGKKCLSTYDDPYYSNIKDYMDAASKMEAKFLIDPEVYITDNQGENLSTQALAEAKKELDELIKQYQSK